MRDVVRLIMWGIVGMTGIVAAAITGAVEWMLLWLMAMIKIEIMITR